MLMRNASLKRVAKGSYTQGFSAPASLIKQSNTARATSLAASVKDSAENGSVSRLLLEMIHNSGLNRDRDLKKRLEQTGAEELIRIAGLQQGAKRVPKRIVDGPSARASKAPSWTPDIQLIPHEMQGDGSIEVVGVVHFPSPDVNGLKNAYTETLKVMNARQPAFMRTHTPM
jgi:hypothetical protein